MRSKSYKAVKEKAPEEVIDTQTAVAFLKEHARAGFDETIEIHINLGINPEKSDQMVRSSVNLPSGAPKAKKVVVFTDDTSSHDEIKKAGAQLVGGEDLIKQIEDTGSIDADITIATPSMMPKIAKVARVLGPKGLMPNPKTGTVSENPAETVKELASGKLSFKMDKLGNIHEAIGKVSWDAEKVTANVEAIVEAVKAARPAATKGEFINSVTLSSTMSPAIRITY